MKINDNDYFRNKKIICSLHFRCIIMSEFEQCWLYALEYDIGLYTWVPVAMKKLNFCVIKNYGFICMQYAYRLLCRNVELVGINLHWNEPSTPVGRANLAKFGLTTNQVIPIETKWLVNSHSFILTRFCHSFIHSFIYSYIHSFIHSFNHSIW